MLASLPLSVVLGLFALAVLVVAVVGVRITDLADRLADRTGLGEAVAGAVLLGATTSLSGTVVSVTAALDGRASLAYSNGVGGIAAQTAFLAVADLLHRRANLEHASAEIANIFQAGLLIVMLSLPLVAYAAPDVSLWSVNPVSLVLLVVYIAGVRAASQVREQPMWLPVGTPETREDRPEADREPGVTVRRLAVRLGLLGLALGASGYVLAQAGGRISDDLGISESAVGALMTAVATSLPELVTTLAAVRRGALQLAVGGIIGGNTFDVLFLALSDIFYREGSLYHAVGRSDLLWLVVGLLLSAVLILGLVMREKRGPANIGFESLAILVIYGGAIAVQVAVG